jgi:hypothetical protein
MAGLCDEADMDVNCNWAPSESCSVIRMMVISDSSYVQLGIDDGPGSGRGTVIFMNVRAWPSP